MLQEFAEYAVKGQVTGLVKNVGGLSYLRMYGAGHWVNSTQDLHSHLNTEICLRYQPMAMKDWLLAKQQRSSLTRQWKAYP